MILYFSGTGNTYAVARAIAERTGEKLLDMGRAYRAHDSDLVRFEGLVPDRQVQMPELIVAQLPEPNEGAARKMREMLILGLRSA